MSYTYKGVDVPSPLQKLHVTRMGRQNQEFTIEFTFQASDGQPIAIAVIFKIKRDIGETLEEFKKKAKNRISLTPEHVERTIAALSNDEYCRKLLAYYEKDTIAGDGGNDDNNNDSSSNNLPEIGEPEPNNNNNNNGNSDEQEEAYASSASDPDYTDEGLPLYSVSTAIRKDPQRMRVTGIIEIVRPLFKLATRVFFMCADSKCNRFGIRESYVLDRPLFQDFDIGAIGFAGGYKEYDDKVSCLR
jgi:hypothetical protein